MTEERKVDLALDGIVHNIVSECNEIMINNMHVYDGIENLKNLIQEYDKLKQEYNAIRENHPEFNCY